MAATVAERDAQPETDRVWSIETNGINYIPESERHGRPIELFWIWFAANISVLAMIYGPIVVGFGLNLWQSILAAIVGVWLSFLLVGFISVAGVRAGAPTLALSRAVFGVFGNVLPNIVSYLTLLGWETVLVALSALTVDAVFARLGLPTGNGLLAVAFIVVAALIIAIGLLGHATIALIQTWFTWAFAALTVVFAILELPQIDYSKLASAPAGSWLNGFVPAVSIVMAGLGIGWVNSAADYSRYLPRRSSLGSVVGWVTVGGSVAPMLLIFLGILVAGKQQNDLFSANPIGALAAHLPTWFLVPYLIVGVGGLVAGAVLDLYSSGLNLLTLGVRLPRYQSVVIDGTVMVLGNIYILFIAKNFLGPFQDFLIVMGIPLACWAAVFLVDMAMFHRNGYAVEDLYTLRGAYRYQGGVNVRALAAWIVGIVVGFGLYQAPAGSWSWLSHIGWWASKGSPFAGSSLGLFVGFAVAGVLYFLLSLTVLGRSHPATSEVGAPAS